jgi:hypothetical protein
VCVGVWQWSGIGNSDAFQEDLLRLDDGDSAVMLWYVRQAVLSKPLMIHTK